MLSLFGSYIIGRFVWIVKVQNFYKLLFAFIAMNNTDFNFNFGDKVRLKISDEAVEGTILESPDSEFYLVKLKSGYNIGVRKENVNNVAVLGKAEVVKEKPLELPKNSLPRIDIIMTGGTISSRVDYKTGGVTSLTKPEDFFRFYPEIFEVVQINEVMMPFMKPSENMEYKDWKEIGECVEKSLNNPEVEGVIITHGTDILHYTSAILSFFFPKPNKPIVLTFSQRSTDRASSDASLNLQCAAQTATSNIAEVVIVGHENTNDDSCYALLGTKVRKMHSTARDTFKPINTAPLARVWADGKIEKITPFRERSPRTEKNEKVKGDIVFNEKIGMIKFYPGQKPEILEYYTKNYEGLIIEGTGMGHVITDGEKNWIPMIKKAINNGLLIFMTTQTIKGRTNKYVYSPLRELSKAGVIFLDDMLAETAFVKLGWVMGHKAWKDKEMIKKKMLENISGEFNERILK